MKIIKTLILLLVAAISAYSLITREYSFAPISSLLLGTFFGILAFEEFKHKGKNSWGMFYMPVSLLIIMMALFSF